MMMRTFEVDHTTRPTRTQRLWVAETLVVLGIVGFGLFALTLEGHFSPFAKPQAAVELPFELTR
jgi:hypothetical protein